ncbi:MAG: cupredoxin family copper-binding protein [Rhodospirillales bacterium]|nr:cupredoxin family copper-binding protein [Rhodospirillales bacterium]MBO6786864.1 cupredoxin family copper-binding protein [Rhodospirillales bacterium]
MTPKPTYQVGRRAFLARVMAALAAVALPAWPSRTRAADGGAEHVIDIRDLTFRPATLDVRAGDTITWVNHDIAPHTATAADKSWDTGLLKRGEQGSITVKPGMTTQYFCRFHPAMKAVVRVVG